MPYRPKGTRVSLNIPPNLSTLVANHPRVAAQMAQTLAKIGARADQTVPEGEGTHDGVHLKDTRETEILITPRGVVGLIGYTAYWAHFVHNGTVRQPANPWLLNSALSVLVAGRVPSRRAA